MNLYTAQYRYSGKDRLDITVQGNNPLGAYFAPTWAMVNDYKRAVRSRDGRQIIAAETRFRVAYQEILNRIPGHIWKQLLSLTEVTLVCFCRAEAFCHRLLLSAVLVQLGARYCGER